MTNEKLLRELKNIKLDDCVEILHNYIYHIIKRVKYRVYNVNGTYYYDCENYEFLIIAPNKMKKAIILRYGYRDLHWVVVKKWRNQHVLSNALRTGIIKKIWVENKEITCCYDWNDNKDEKLSITKHLAMLAGLKVKQ